MLLSATLHRSWYAAGDIVRAEICLHAFPNTHGGVTNELLMRFRQVDNYFAEIDDDYLPSIRVNTLSAQIVGVCDVDSRRIHYGLNEKISTNGESRALIEEKIPKYHVIHKLFSSEEFFLAKELPIRERETKAFAVTFALPDYLPPSYRGQCVRFYYGLHIYGTYSKTRETSVPMKLRLPIKVFSSQAVISPLLLPPYFPLENFDFREKVVLLQPVPSPSVTDPLQDHLMPSDVESFNVRQLWERVTNSIAKRLSEQRTPLEHPVKIGGELVVTVVILSTTVTIGDSLNGVFLLQPNPKSQLIKVIGVVEFLECCSRDHLKKGITCYPLPGEEERGLTVVQTAVIEEYEWALLGRDSVSFSLSFTNWNYYASMQTDVVTTCWQLRIRFLCSSPSALQQFYTGRSDGFEIAEDEPELVIPLTIVPPPHREHPRMGNTVQVLC
ncbi:Reduced growth phenotype protein 1 [Trypanosoma melophagium]|uniref:Reduced growth phenotype protein 1 n=1 Tax=Trypanosoma melophagium TaxID=715481 RepID=UPI00351A0C47|nr:Reduced growth phenotype protein 1 [Trypanosoma melophagium]